jgi:hypothetical protein
MTIFSRYFKVLESGGSEMGVRTALGLINAGIILKKAGRVQLVARDSLNAERDPIAEAQRLTVWQLTQHLARAVEIGGEEAAVRIILRRFARRDRQGSRLSAVHHLRAQGLAAGSAGLQPAGQILAGVAETGGGPGETIRRACAFGAMRGSRESHKKEQ